jgi:hypothetical protein
MLRLAHETIQTRQNVLTSSIWTAMGTACTEKIPLESPIMKKGVFGNNNRLDRRITVGLN